MSQYKGKGKAVKGETFGLADIGVKRGQQKQGRRKAEPAEEMVDGDSGIIHPGGGKRRMTGIRREVFTMDNAGLSVTRVGVISGSREKAIGSVGGQVRRMGEIAEKRPDATRGLEPTRTEELFSDVDMEEAKPVVSMVEATPVVAMVEAAPVVTMEEVKPVVTMDEVKPVVTMVEEKVPPLKVYGRHPEVAHMGSPAIGPDTSEESLSSSPELPDVQMEEVQEIDTNELILNFDPDTFSRPSSPPIIPLMGLSEAEAPSTALILPPPKEVAIIRTRAYQREMFEESMQRNIIVCQGTGSGKTHVAILRIRHEIEHSPPHQLSWFLVPNRPLGEQQFNALQSGLPPVPMKFLSGADNVEKWNSGIWNEILMLRKEGQVRVIVSTHQVLLDALTHGFVTMDDLSLLIFDEDWSFHIAHHCIRDHPSNHIMKNFYHPRLHAGEPLPMILGLTASPLFNGSVSELQIIESNLHAICRTPTVNRSALNQHSHLPKLRPVLYAPNTGFGTTPSLSYPYLLHAYDRMDIEDDPFVKSMPKATMREITKYEKVINSKATYCMQQMKAFVNKSQHVISEYGGWAGDYYISTVVASFNQLILERGDELVGWVDEEKLYLWNILSQVKTFDVTDRGLLKPGALSPKAETLIGLLVEEYEADQKRGEQSFSGIVFVEQRVGVAVLAEILSRHIKTREIFQCGTLVGTSVHSARTGKSLCELVDSKVMNTTLKDFREGNKNLIIATSVAEEGLDVQACHLVVCCYPQTTKKSYVQMRGRARRVHSTYVLMFENQDSALEKLAELDLWEKEMLKAYQDERELQEREEQPGEEGEEQYHIGETKSLLTYHNAIPHLHHFCGVIPHSQYIDFRPDFYTYPEPDYLPIKRWTCQLTLPSCIPPDLRTHQSKHLWKTEKMAERDVAFQAYIRLYENGLVDKHWMPLATTLTDEELEMEDIAKKTSTEKVPQQLDPFRVNWKTNAKGEVETYSSILSVEWMNGELVNLEMILPFACPKMGEFTFWWASSEAVKIRVTENPAATFLSPLAFTKAQETTYTLFDSVFWNKMEKNRMDFPYLFCPADGQVEVLASRLPALDALRGWTDMNLGQILGIVRDKSQTGKQYIFKSWNSDAVLTPEELQRRYPNHELLPNTPLVEVTPVPKRRNYAKKYINRPEIEDVEEVKARARDSKSTFLLPQVATFDCIPWKIQRTVLLVPCILRRLEIYATAKELQETVMKDVAFDDLKNVVTAITASSAREETNYQRYELLGDSVLKFLAGIQLLAEHPLWHEGYLSGKKDRSVANSKLASESFRLKMSRFIITSEFSPQKWKPKYLDLSASKNPGEKRNRKEPKRNLSSKILADIVESLMGAAYLEGSFDKALRVAQIFNLGMTWAPLSFRLETLFDRAPTPDGMYFPPYLRQLEALLGYTFTQKSLLLEAITHPGCNTDTNFVSYQRMEFLGDSVLDMAIVDKLFRHENRLSHVDMHLYKSACVTADFLAFICLHNSITVTDAECKSTLLDPETGEIHLLLNSTPSSNLKVSSDSDSESDSQLQPGPQRQIPIYKFLRHQSGEVARAQQSVYNNYLTQKPTILSHLHHGKNYPWTSISSLNAEKFFSDLIESLLGAIYIDSRGSFPTIVSVLTKLGVIDILDRLLQDKVDPRHPVTKLGVYAAGKMGQKRTRYSVGAEGGKFFCKVWVDNREICKVVGTDGRHEARTRAAEMAYEILVNERGGEAKGEMEVGALEGMEEVIDFVEREKEEWKGKGKGKWKGKGKETDIEDIEREEDGGIKLVQEEMEVVEEEEEEEMEEEEEEEEDLS